MTIYPGGGITVGKHATIDHAGIAGVGNAKIITGTYTGDGAASREINIGGEAKFGMVMGTNTAAANMAWLVMKGAETMFAEPMVGSPHAGTWNVVSHNGASIKPSTNGFTLAAAANFESNANTRTYYYAMIIQTA